MLIEKNEKEKSKKNKFLTIAAIKAKGYKYEIKEIFDKEIPIFPKIKKSLSDNYFLKNQTLIKKYYENPTEKNKRLLKIKNKNTNLILSLSNLNYSISKENTKKICFSEENNKSKIKFNDDNYSLLKSKNQFNLTLSTNFSINKTNKIKNLKAKFFNNKLIELKSDQKIKENSKNKDDIESPKMKNIESILNKKFIDANKKFYLGNNFKKKLDNEKKRFNLIKYKNYFNNK